MTASRARPAPESDLGFAGVELAARASGPGLRKVGPTLLRVALAVRKVALTLPRVALFDSVPPSSQPAPRPCAVPRQLDAAPTGVLCTCPLQHDIALDRRASRIPAVRAAIPALERTL